MPRSALPAAVDLFAALRHHAARAGAAEAQGRVLEHELAEVRAEAKEATTHYQQNRELFELLATKNLWPQDWEYVLPVVEKLRRQHMWPSSWKQVMPILERAYSNVHFI